MRLKEIVHSEKRIAVPTSASNIQRCNENIAITRNPRAKATIDDLQTVARVVSSVICLPNGVPYVWSFGGPVKNEEVEPVLGDQSKSSVLSCVHPHRPLSNVHCPTAGTRREGRPLTQAAKRGHRTFPGELRNNRKHAR